MNIKRGALKWQFSENLCVFTILMKFHFLAEKKKFKNRKIDGRGLAKSLTKYSPHTLNRSTGHINHHIQKRTSLKFWSKLSAKKYFFIALVFGENILIGIELPESFLLFSLCSCFNDEKREEKPDSKNLWQMRSFSYSYSSLFCFFKDEKSY